MIEEVQTTPLRQISDERGKVMHMLRVNDAIFSQFGEVYFSCIYPGAVKAWKLHKEMTLNCVVPCGNVKFVIYDSRIGSTGEGGIKEYFMGPDNYFLLTVPPGVWTGFKCIGTEQALLVNCATLPHTIDECERKDFNDRSIPYNWS